MACGKAGSERTTAEFHPIAVDNPLTWPRILRCTRRIPIVRAVPVGAWRSPVSALVWETRGRWFKSSRPDQTNQTLIQEIRRSCFPENADGKRMGSKRMPRPSATEGAPSPECTIKGNINRNGERIYHTQSHKFYARIKMHRGGGRRWFCTPEEAEAAGWRRAFR